MATYMKIHEKKNNRQKQASDGGTWCNIYNLRGSDDDTH